MTVKTQRPHSNGILRGEKGAALVMVLVVLLSLTVFGLGVITSTTTNVALSRNFETATQALNMAEVGARVAYREFINGGFLRTTHRYGGSQETPSDSLLATTLEDYTVDSDGWYVWEWDTSAGHDPLFDTGEEHGFKFRVFYNTPNGFVIESEGWYGPITRRIRAKGEIESMFQFSYFASRDLGEFTRGASQEIRGKVHANGNMYVRPTGSTLWVNTNSFTATGFIIRTRDAWGRPDQSGACQITKNSEDSGIWVEMEPDVYGVRGADGSAFDSYGADWSDQSIGAREKWGGVVRDRVPHKSPPPIQNLDSGEFYDQKAQDNGLVISSTSHAQSWCSKVTNFYNFNEERYQTLWDIDVDALNASGDFPTNGLIYCDVPIRLSNAAELDGPLMVASCRTVYLKGNYNSINKVGASVMTKHRIYYLSESWDDAAYGPSTSTSSRVVSADTTYVNAAFVDGAPTVDEYNWVDRDGNHMYDYPNNTRYIYADWNNKTPYNHQDPLNSGDPWANCDDLIENWSGKSLRKFGSVVHLGSSHEEMTDNLDNSGISDDEIAWVRSTGYNPPNRIYLYDPDLASASGQPPFTPLIGHITAWSPY